MTLLMAMLRESLTKNMVKMEVKEPPRDLTNCKKRLEMEDCYLFDSSTPTYFISAEKKSA